MWDILGKQQGQVRFKVLLDGRNFKVTLQRGTDTMRGKIVVILASNIP